MHAFDHLAHLLTCNSDVAELHNYYSLVHKTLKLPYKCSVVFDN